jgi:amino acid adenylation domain-containing protein
MVRHPGTRQARLTRQDLSQLAEWSTTPAPYVPAASLHELIERQAERTPEVTALSYGHVSLSYRELNERSSQLAHRLRRHGAGPESIVGVCMRRSADLVVTLLAVLKSGSAYLPLDADYPGDRLAHMISDSGTGLIVTEDALADRLPPGSAETLMYEQLDLAAEPVTTPRSGCSPENTVYVMYTSGSTGTPKGVAVAHRSMVNYVEAVRAKVGFAPGWQHALLQSVCFDFTVSILWGSLVTGGTLHVLPAEIAYDPDELWRFLIEKDITCIKITPSHLAALDLTNGLPPAFRCLVVGGEASDRAWLQALRRANDIPIFNSYGPTEATGCAGLHEISGDSGAECDVTPIGPALPGCSLHVLDERYERVPAGVTGDLYVGGAGVARGYFGRPAMTAERFIPDPFSPGKRLYQTGDRARYLLDGNLEFLGRADAQLKIQGFRIEPSEIEAALMSHPRVAQAVATVAGDRLVGYVVPSGSLPSKAELRRFLRRTLPEYMVPAEFEEISSLPMTVNGKLDRAWLTQLAASRVQPGTSGEQPVASGTQLIANRKESHGIPA